LVENAASATAEDPDDSQSSTKYDPACAYDAVSVSHEKIAKTSRQDKRFMIPFVEHRSGASLAKTVFGFNYRSRDQPTPEEVARTAYVDRCALAVGPADTHHFEGGEETTWKVEKTLLKAYWIA
jgi:hypothetical protein